MKKTEFTRQEFYELVWKEPLSRLAKKYNISDNGLRKRCKKLNIPLPEVGYWQKLQYNKPVTRKKLPKDNPSGIEKIDLSDREEEHNPKDSPISRIKRLRKSYNQLNQDIFKVQSRLSNPDKLVAQAQKTLIKKETGSWSDGLVHTYYGEISIKVAPSNVSRALRFFNSLIKLLRLRGHDIKVRNDSTYAIVEGEEIAIAIREKLRIEKTVDKNNWNTNNYFPTDKLILKIGWIHVKEFMDGKNTLEEMLPDILAHLEYLGQKEKEDRIQREINWAKYEEQERLKKELEARKKQELDDVKLLFKESNSWHKSNILNNYINEIEKRAIETNSLTDELKNWLTWAKQKADWYNPLIRKEDEFLTDIDRLIF
ncbi:hypothetical protein [Plebeiibacterium marinum]|uniref:Uncharacterized protein n=1 Tax=Plebeiibacterium marinum TaxID=2992111 RepID=A0AAE3MDW0_9BACT|nr:hypothetical protein [Plebeiobacterium marinum]MCW3805724.1 hypothetical protein [Plebeiobacterium marinum]